MLRAVCRFTWRPEPTAITRWCASALSSPASTEGANDGDVAWNCMSPENETRCRGMLEEPTGIYRASKAGAAVLVPLCSVGGEPALLYTLRSSELRGKHKGDVSFPGGKSDPSDRDIVHTALREAQEELGIQVMEESTWGVMKPIMDLAGMAVAPVVANLGPLESLSLKPNRNEVEDIFTLSIPHLCMENNQAYTHFRLRGRYAYTLPVFLGGKHRVWGLTAILTDSALKMLVPSTYQSKVFGTRKV
ncbi:mitochondrial coenzyme A diphosphatase NUDT8 isoform X1 [Ambystoma mexicanum]|uniref:mitochondrial coenzyme A diphosphatase NUDT8 isoform X1 n=1 Tax=Ambystoma mexicanum TaxID=8296 RepID=UPI0037E8CE6D